MGNDSGPDPLSPAQRILILRDHLERERSRRREAEAKLAEIRTVLLEGGQDAATVRRRALAIVGTEEGAHDG